MRYSRHGLVVQLNTLEMDLYKKFSLTIRDRQHQTRSNKRFPIVISYSSRISWDCGQYERVWLHGAVYIPFEVCSSSRINDVLGPSTTSTSIWTLRTLMNHPHQTPAITTMARLVVYTAVQLVFEGD
ncbi:hypothetical protein PM082_020134 [Marasmius tenuissimus]|nr:hypothetical protein PM082_020134 [Marasmius tenuissimus]